MIAIATSVAMLVLTLCFFPHSEVAGDMGICLPSPNEWRLPGFLSWLLDACLVFISLVMVSTTNRRYNFIPSTAYAMPALLAVLVASCCPATVFLSTSTLLMAVNIVAISILLGTYESHNATRQFFLISSLLAVGSMVQYAFLMMMPVYVAGGLLMKSFRFREMAAFLLGIIAPYWIVLGLGIVPLASLRVPDTLRVVDTTQVDHTLFIALLSGGIMSALALIFSLYNSMRLLMRNSRPRSMHAAIMVMGMMSMLCMIFNFNNFMAYVGSIALWFSIETAMMFELYEVRAKRVWTGVLSAIFVTLFIFFL